VEGCACAVGRRLVVCARNNCWKCNPERENVPEDCEYEILHSLETYKGAYGIQAFPRQSGKTTRIIEYANYLAKGSYRVFYLTLNHQMVERVYHLPVPMDKKVIGLGWQQAEKHLNGVPPGFVLADEVLPSELKKIAQSLSRHKLIAAWYTPR
jgi:hypothetical protein